LIISKYNGVRKKVKISTYHYFFIALIAFICNPLQLFEGSNGRYITVLISNVDTQLFNQDIVVDSLSNFKSLFYMSISKFFNFFSLSLSYIDLFFLIIFFFYKFFLCYFSLKVISFLTDDEFSRVLFVFWILFSRGNEIGGGFIQTGQIGHLEVAFLIQLIAFYLLIKKEIIIFCLMSSMAILIHPLVSLHFLIGVLPIFIFNDKKIKITNYKGLVFILISTLYYMNFMSSTSFDNVEQQIFYNAKSHMEHVNLKSAGIVSWIGFVGIIAQFFVLTIIYSNNDKIKKSIFYYAISVLTAGLLLSFIVTYFGNPKLYKIILFQPLRMLVWFWFFSHLLIISRIGYLYKKNKKLGLLIICSILFNVVGNVWYIYFIYLSIMFMILDYFVEKNKLSLNQYNYFINFTFLASGIFIFAGYVFSYFFSADSSYPESFSYHTNIIFIIIIYLFSRIRNFPPFNYYLIPISLFIMVFVQASFSKYETGKNKIDYDLIEVGDWLQKNTDKEDIILDLSIRSENLRALSHRSTIGKTSSAIVWVTPRVFEAEKIKNAIFKDEIKNKYFELDKIKSLSVLMNPTFVLVDSDKIKDTKEINHHFGKYGLINLGYK
tara:strand:- start:1870 stop:3681 length:1812 start_codon:yes stop_codon:yes gene_type:complete